ncbi:MAG: helix-turn-helix domain-containing protein [Actinomycetota bacterium]
MQTIRKAREATLPKPPKRKRLRIDNGYSQKEFGAFIGKSAASVCRYEAGTTLPRGRALRAYGALLRELERRDKRD